MSVVQLHASQRGVGISVAPQGRINLDEQPQRSVKRYNERDQAKPGPNGKPREAKYIQHGCLQRGHAAPGLSAY